MDSKTSAQSAMRDATVFMIRLSEREPALHCSTLVIGDRAIEPYRVELFRSIC